MNLLRKINFYVRSWEKDRDILFPNYFKKLMLALILGIVSFFSYYILLSERHAFNDRYSHFLELKHDLSELRGNKDMNAKNAHKVKLLDARNFYGELKEYKTIQIWNEVVKHIKYPAKSDFEIVPSKSVIMLGKNSHHAVMFMDLKTDAYYWHENDLIDFFSELDVLPIMLRENECLLNRTSKKFTPLELSEVVQAREPGLEAKCVLGLFWVQ